MVQAGGPVTGDGSAGRSALARRLAGAATALVVALSLAGIALQAVREIRLGPVPSFQEQACGLPKAWLERTRRGYFEPRSGQISLLPRTPAYMASGGDGWSHSGPWPYLQEVPLVFYGPGIVPSFAGVETPATTADIAPTMAALVDMPFSYGRDGSVLEDVVQMPGTKAPRLILTIVLDGGGWNTLRMYDGDWPNLERLMAGGISFTNATVGSSPSVTPAVHSTLGTGSYPWTAGVTGVPVRDEEGEVVDAFLEGESGRFLQRSTFAEVWDERKGNRPLVGMLGYEPWHLGMIGKGAELRGDKDDAVWLNVETNEWITNPDHYTLPPEVARTGGLDRYLEELDAEDGAIDDAWLDNEILAAPDRVEETPAFIRFHADALLNMVREGGYGDDAVTDLLFTNFKQIDRVGHYFNMASPEVRQSLITTDEQLGRIVEGVEEDVGRGNYVIVVTADHGQQPDEAAVDGFGIDPNEVERDIDAEFGPISDAVWPTEVFLDDEALRREGVTVEEVARWLGDYRLEDNVQDVDAIVGGRELGAVDRAFELAIPARMLPGIECGG